jgi:hypothetical protein
MSTATHLRSIVLNWPHLADALGTPVQHGAFGLGLRGYLAALNEFDAAEAAALRAMERDPAQIGERPIPIRLKVHETMRTVQAALVECADVVAGSVQRVAMSPAPAYWPAGDRERRNQLARTDAADPRRWRWTGTRPGGQYAALWLLARVEGAPGPFRPLDEAQAAFIGTIARGAAERIEATLDIGSATAALARPCPCGGTITVHGGGGASPLANCGACGAIWTEAGIAA